MHLSNVAAREDFRQRSFFSDVAIGTIAGFGVASYELALDAATRHLARGGQMMDIRKVKKLIELLEESGISEIEISEGEESVRISRYPQPRHRQRPNVRHPPLAAPPRRPRAAARRAERPRPQRPPAARGQQVTAPMVGTFYSGPGARREAVRRDRHGGQARRHALRDRGDEDDEPDRVRRSRGEVVSILVENGSPVEFGQTLFIIEE